MKTQRITAWLVGVAVHLNSNNYEEIISRGSFRAVFSSIVRTAGTFTLQPKVGLNVASMTELDGSDPRIGLAVGAEGQYQFSDLVGVSFGLLYSQQGATGEFNFMGINADQTMKLDYINVPILANVYLFKGLAVKLGIQPAFKVNSSVKTTVNGHSESVDLDGVKGFDFSIPVGLSYEFSNVVFDARYNFGCTKTFEKADSRHSVFQFTVGYKFAL